MPSNLIEHVHGQTTIPRNIELIFENYRNSEMVDRATIKLLLGAFLFTFVRAELFLTPSENQWTRTGANVELSCKASEKISKCSWNTAYNELYQFSNEGQGSIAESGRLQYSLNEDETECGLKITNVTEQDVGRWTCHISTVTSDHGVTAGKAHTTLTIASRPDSVHLEEPYNQDSINVSLDDEQSPKQIRCSVKNADPKPTFNWYIGETRLETKLSSGESQTKDVKDDNNTWIQTLFYKPEVLHDNQTVRLPL